MVQNKTISMIKRKTKVSALEELKDFMKQKQNQKNLEEEKYLKVAKAANDFMIQHTAK